MIDRNDQEKDRKKYSDLILNSPAKKKNNCGLCWNWKNIHILGIA